MQSDKMVFLNEIVEKPLNCKVVVSYGNAYFVYCHDANFLETIQPALQKKEATEFCLNSLKKAIEALEEKHKEIA